MANEDALQHWAQRDAGRVALIEYPQRRRWTYGELDQLANRWCRWLQRAGVLPADRVAILASNRASHVALLFACSRSASVLVPLNWRLAGPELARVVATAAPTLILADRAFADLLERAAVSPSLCVDLDMTTAEVAAERASACTEHDSAGDGDAALILYTSGSTGEPKGAVLTHAQQHWNARATIEGWDLRSSDIALVITPFFHTAGWNVFATPLWRAGGAIVLLSSSDPDDFLRAMREERCTLAFAVPTQYQLLVAHPDWGAPLPALRFLVSGGAPCPPALDRAVRAAGYPFRNAYGLTECGPNCFTTTNRLAAADPQSVGWPIPFLQARVVDDTGQDVATGAIGELWLRGPQLFGGYFRDPDATADALTRDGWLRTGDLASRDDAGNHTIAGRRTEMYISGGSNIFPGEVEAALLEHPAIAEAAVVGVPDAWWGEAGAAFIVLRPGTAVDDEALRAFLRRRLAGYKLPRTIGVVGAIPRLGGGKPDRRALASQIPS